MVSAFRIREIPLEVERVYWGCTTHRCERGFYGTEEAMPEDWTTCSACGGELAEITVWKKKASAS